MLPQDRESVYWINVKAIPASKDAEAKNVLQIAVRSPVLKTVLSSGGPERQGQYGRLEQTAVHQRRLTIQIKVENPSAFNLTFTKFYANGPHGFENGMVPAKAH